MLPTITDLKKIARQRSALLRASEKGLLERTATLERKLNTYILNTLIPSLDIRNNRITNTNRNLKIINNPASLKTFIKNVVNADLYKYYNNQFNRLNDATSLYYDRFALTKAATEKIYNRASTISSGYVDELFDNNDIVRQVQNSIRANIIAEARVSNVKSLMTEIIKGKENKFGAITSFHYKNGFDGFQKYSRGLDEQFSKALKLNYAIYAGGEIKTTRPFCEERAGNVYNRETILEWNDLEWSGKIPDGNILTDLGGYNCRHDLDWISYELAKRIDPDIEKSKFDK